MATHAQIRARSDTARLQPVGLAGIAAAALFVALCGIYWDVTWHVVYGRDSFWIPPHRVVYAGVALTWLVGVIGALTMRGRDRRVSLGFCIGALGPTIQGIAAPIDNTWHNTIGLDPTVWSPPHLMGIVGGGVGVLGMLLALSPYIRAERGSMLLASLSRAEWVALLLFGGGLSLALFSLGDLDFELDNQDYLLFPLMAGALSTLVLLAAGSYFRRPGAATLVALIYMVFRSLVLIIVWRMGLTDALTPPIFVLAPAVAIDLAQALNPRWGYVLGAVLAGPALLWGEWLYRGLFDTYPWSFLQVFASTTTVAAIATIGGLAGMCIGTMLREGTLIPCLPAPRE